MRCGGGAATRRVNVHAVEGVYQQSWVECGKAASFGCDEPSLASSMLHLVRVRVDDHNQSRS
eukprot:COSAG01_NODE_67873_length_265_cov_2.463855_2_plen_61_part_01